VPNKHLCDTQSPAPVPSTPDTPPASPPSKDSLLETSSITYPPDAYCTKWSHNPPTYTITGNKLAMALEHLATQALPNPEQVFPWLHGLHADNQIQLAFFTSRRKSVRRIPRCIRSITVVKAGGDLSHSKIKGAIAPEELLTPSVDDCGTFLECDPKDGFSVRNFQIQACKLAMVSDIIVYGDGKTSQKDVNALAKRISSAQRQYEARNGFSRGLFNTFILSGKLSPSSSQELLLT
jgi:dual specificity MAP kinase phosphatase